MLTKLGISTAPGAMIGAAADDRAGHRAEAGVGEFLLAPAGELRRHLVPPMRAAGAAGDRLHRVEAERQQHGFLEPLVDDPLAADLLGDARLAAIERGDRRIDRLADFALGRRRDRVALAPTRARSRPAGSFIHRSPRMLFEPFADVGHPDVDDASRHSRGCRAPSHCRPTPSSCRALCRREVAGPCPRPSRRAGLDAELVEQLAIAVQLGLGRQVGGEDVVQMIDIRRDAEPRRAPSRHNRHCRWCG